MSEVVKPTHYKCPRCNGFKKPEEFHRDNRPYREGKRNVSSYCKQCIAGYQKERYWNDEAYREKTLKKMRERRRAERLTTEETREILIRLRDKYREVNNRDGD